MSNTFENLIAWQKARVLTRRIYEISRTSPFCRDYGFCDQIRSASISIMANIAEGHGRGNRTEFNRFLVIALGSCTEVRSHLYVALDAGYLDKEQFESLYLDADEVGRITQALRLSVQSQKRKES